MAPEENKRPYRPRIVAELARLGPALGLAGLLVLGAVALPPAASAMAPDAGTIDPPPVITLKVGTKRVLKIPGLQQVAVGDEEIADIQVVGPDELEITARSPGATTVIVWSQSGGRRSCLVKVKK